MNVLSFQCWNVDTQLCNLMCHDQSIDPGSSEVRRLEQLQGSYGRLKSVTRQLRAPEISYKAVTVSANTEVCVVLSLSRLFHSHRGDISDQTLSCNW